MSSEAICPMCKHLAPRSTCGNSQSPLAGKHVTKSDQCSLFLENPAQVKYGEALVASLAAGSTIPVIPTIQSAIELGLPQDDEIAARFQLSDGYREIFGNSDGSMERIVAMPEFAKSIDEAEQALKIDAQGNFGYFAEPLNRARLDRLNYIYQMEARTIKDRNGTQAAINYVENKLRLFSYLPSTPMYSLLNELAGWYIEVGQPENAKKQFRTIVDAAPVNIGENDGREQQVRDYSASKLAELSAAPALDKSSPEARSQRKARNSIICGVVGLFLFGWLLGPIAIILGAAARSRIIELKAGSTGKAMAGIILGGVATIIGCVQIFQLLMPHHR